MVRIRDISAWSLGEEGRVVSKSFVDSPYVIDLRDGLVNVDCSSGLVSLLMPSAVSGLIGHEVTIKKLDGSVNFVGVIPLSGQTIDNDTSYNIKNKNATRTLISDGANWWIK